MTKPLSIKKLSEFLKKAKSKGFANATGAEDFKEGEDSSFSTKFEEGDFKYHDNWFGGEPFAGREVVWFKGKPVWMMVFFGEDYGIRQETIPFLQKALRKMPEELPVRGPKKLKENGFIYTNKWKGSLTKFIGKESINFKGKEVYEATYRGGLVNQRKDNV